MNNFLIKKNQVDNIIEKYQPEITSIQNLYNDNISEIVDNYNKQYTAFIKNNRNKLNNLTDKNLSEINKIDNDINKGLELETQKFIEIYKDKIQNLKNSYDNDFDRLEVIIKKDIENIKNKILNLNNMINTSTIYSEKKYIDILNDLYKNLIINLENDNVNEILKNEYETDILIEKTEDYFKINEIIFNETENITNLQLKKIAVNLIDNKTKYENEKNNLEIEIKNFKKQTVDKMNELSEFRNALEEYNNNKHLNQEKINNIKNSDRYINYINELTTKDDSDILLEQLSEIENKIQNLKEINNNFEIEIKKIDEIYKNKKTVIESKLNESNIDKINDINNIKEKNINQITTENNNLLKHLNEQVKSYNMIICEQKKNLGVKKGEELNNLLIDINKNEEELDKLNSFVKVCGIKYIEKLNEINDKYSTVASEEVEDLNNFHFELNNLDNELNFKKTFFLEKEKINNETLNKLFQTKSDLNNRLNQLKQNESHEIFLKDIDDIYNDNKSIDIKIIDLNNKIFEIANQLDLIKNENKIETFILKLKENHENYLDKNYICKEFISNISNEIDDQFNNNFLSIKENIKVNFDLDIKKYLEIINSLEKKILTNDLPNDLITNVSNLNKKLNNMEYNSSLILEQIKVDYANLKYNLYNKYKDDIIHLILNFKIEDFEKSDNVDNISKESYDNEIVDPKIFIESYEKLKKEHFIKLEKELDNIEYNIINEIKKIL